MFIVIFEEQNQNRIWKGWHNDNMVNQVKMEYGVVLKQL